MSDVFISHVEEDEQDALQIARGLEERGYSTWYYERDSIPGPSYLLQTGASIEESQAVVILISRSSLESHQITKEIVRAHESGKPFIPVLIGVTHAAFQTKQPEWREALGAAASVRIKSGQAAAVMPRIVAGLQALGVRSRQGQGQPASPPAVDDSALLASATAGRTWRSAVQQDDRRPWLVAAALVTLVVVVMTAWRGTNAGSKATATATAMPGAAATSAPATRPALTSEPTRAVAAATTGAVATPTTRLTPTVAGSVAGAVASAKTATPAATAPLIRTYNLPMSEPWDVVFDGSSLRVLFSGQLVRVDSVEAESRFRTADTQKGFSTSAAVTFDADAKQFWTVRGAPWWVGEEIDLRDSAGTVLATYTVSDAFTGYPRRLAWQSGNLWVSSDKGPLYKMKPNDTGKELEVLDSYAPSVSRFPGRSIEGMTWVGDNLWVLSDGILSKLDRTIKVVCKLELPSGYPQPDWAGARGVAWDGTYLWVAHMNANLLFRVDPTACK